jgi:hypothetical protein
MLLAPPFFADLAQDTESTELLTVELPDPESEQISEFEFQQQIEQAWQVCDRFDLQTDIWRGRILRAVRDREKKNGEGRGFGFLNWLKDREISKSSAYNLIELANSADSLLADGVLEPEDVNQFSKRAFVETAKASPEVQQLVGEAAQRGDRITRREVRQLSDDWTAMTSDLLPPEVREKAADQTIPTRYLAPLVKHLEKLPEGHQITIRDAVAEKPDLDTLKQATAEARYLAKYLESATQVQALSNCSVNLELALEEALRLGCLNSAADLVNQAALLEQTIVKLYSTWRRINTLSERLYVDTGASTPELRGLLSCLAGLSGERITTQFGDLQGMGAMRTIALTIEDDRPDFEAVVPLEMGG